MLHHGHRIKAKKVFLFRFYVNYYNYYFLSYFKPYRNIGYF